MVFIFQFNIKIWSNLIKDQIFIVKRVIKMHKVADIEIQHDIMVANKKLAKRNQRIFDKADTFSIDVLGAIGSGKTSLLEILIQKMDHKIGVIAGDVISKFDAGRIEKYGVPVVGLNTGKECHLDAHLVEHALPDLPLEDIDLLFIENVGNLICPVDFDLGSHIRMVVISVSEGDDTVEKHPLIFKDADMHVCGDISDVFEELLTFPVDIVDCEFAGIPGNIHEERFCRILLR